MKLNKLRFSILEYCQCCLCFFRSLQVKDKSNDWNDCFLLPPQKSHKPRHSKPPSAHSEKVSSYQQHIPHFIMSLSVQWLNLLLVLFNFSSAGSCLLLRGLLLLAHAQASIEQVLQVLLLLLALLRLDWSSSGGRFLKKTQKRHLNDCMLEPRQRRKENDDGENCIQLNQFNSP